MDFKKLFIGGLCASAVLAGCTKELSAPSVEGNQAVVSLGEGLTITGSKGSFGAETKAEYFGTGFNARWEDSDVLGAAWYDAATVDAKGVWSSSGNGYNSRFMSNMWFAFDKFENSNHTSATFKAAGNLMAGAYVLYFPAQQWSQLEENIPVEVPTEQVMDITKGNETKHLNDNLFAFTTYLAVPGGEQTLNKFTLNQLTNVLKVNLQVAKDNSTSLIKESLQNIKIKKVVVSGPTISKDGYIEMPGQVADDVYNGKKAVEPAKYVSGETATSISLTIEGESEGYNFVDFGKELENPFYISALPFTSLSAAEAKAIRVSIITSTGEMYQGSLTESNQAALVKGFKEEGGQLLNLHVELVNEVKEGEIYTKEQFVEQLAVLNAGKKIAGGNTLTIATPLELTDVDMEVKAGKTVNLTGEALTVKNLDVKGTLSFDNDLTVTEDFTFGSNAQISGGNLTVGGLTTFSGDATLNNASLNTVQIDKTATVTLDSFVELGNVTNEGTLSLVGTTAATSEYTYISSAITNTTTGKLSANKKVRVAQSGSIVSAGAVSVDINRNEGSISFNKGNNGSAKVLDNYGTVNAGKDAMGTVTVTNNYGTVALNQFAGTMSVLTNKEAGEATATTLAHDAGVINVSGEWAPNATISNEGEINVAAKTTALTSKLDLTNATYTATAGVINAENATVVADAQNPRIVADAKSVITATGNPMVTFVVKNATDEPNSDWASYVDTYRINVNGFTLDQSKHGSKNIELAKGAKVMIASDITLTEPNSFKVLGDATVEISAAKTFTIVSDYTKNEVVGDAVLTVVGKNASTSKIVGQIKVKDKSNVKTSTVNVDGFTAVIVAL